MLTQNRRKNEAPWLYFEDGTEMPSPNAVQLQTTVRKADPRYRIRAKQVPLWLAILFRALIGLGVIALFLVSWAIVFQGIKGD